MKLKLSELLHFHGKQVEATKAADSHRFTLFGGAAGPGKSYWLRWYCIRQLILWHKRTGLKGIHGALFSEDYPTLKDRQISKMQVEIPSWLGEIKQTQTDGFALFLTPSFGSGVLALRNLDDPSKYVSSEFAIIAVEELTKNTEDVFNRLRSRMRWTGIEDTKFIGATNPGEIGHVWVRKRWIDREFPEEEQEADQFAFVQALPTDNPHLADSYRKTLQSLPEKLRKAYWEGSWELFEGQYFSEFDRSVHVVKPFTPPASWKRFRCGDYGFTAPSAVYWVAIDPKGDLWVYRELYKRNLTYSALAQEIKALTPSNENIEYTVFDPAIWAKSGTTGETGSEILSNNGIYVWKGDNDRLNGWGRIREYLRDPQGNPHLFITENCINLIKTLPALVHDKNKVEDVNSKGEDHGPDALRYGVMSRPSPALRDPNEKFKGMNEQQVFMHHARREAFASAWGVDPEAIDDEGNIHFQEEELTPWGL
jgi:phage terminase large subunit